MKHMVIALVAPLALAACLAEEPAAMPEDDACGASALQHLVGQPKSVLDGMTFAPGTRILPPDAAMTMDFRPDRLNIFIDENGLIERLQCV